MKPFLIFLTTFFTLGFSPNHTDFSQVDVPVRMVVFQFTSKGIPEDLAKRMEIEMGMMLFDFANQCPQSLEFIEMGPQDAAIDFGRNLDEEYRNQYQIPAGPRPIPAKANAFILIKLESNSFGTLARMEVLDKNGKNHAKGLSNSDYALNSLYDLKNRKDLMNQLIQKALTKNNLERMIHHFDKRAKIDLSCLDGNSIPPSPGTTSETGVDISQTYPRCKEENFGQIKVVNNSKTLIKRVLTAYRRSNGQRTFGPQKKRIAANDSYVFEVMKVGYVDLIIEYDTFDYDGRRTGTNKCEDQIRVLPCKQHELIISDNYIKKCGR